jgi:hypothetical protein
MSPSRWAPIEEMICEFQGHLAPTVPQFKIEEGVDCADSYPSSKAASPALKKRGVYLIFDDSESLIYIGMAIERSLIERIRNHRTSKRFTPRWIDVIPFDWEWLFFAPSLELFLIDKFARMKGVTLDNKLGTQGAVVDLLDELE